MPAFETLITLKVTPAELRALLRGTTTESLSAKVERLAAEWGVER